MKNSLQLILKTIAIIFTCNVLYVQTASARELLDHAIKAQTLQKKIVRVFDETLADLLAMEKVSENKEARAAVCTFIFSELPDREDNNKIASDEALMKFSDMRNIPVYQQKEWNESIDILSLASVNYRLDLGDLFLKHKCWEQADFYYRFVIENFSQPFYAGKRDRAKIGIDDIRSARD
jgi:hypothetical protein